MADGRWQMTDGKWEMADGKWQMADDRWQMANDRWRMTDGKWHRIAPTLLCHLTFCHSAISLALYSPLLTAIPHPQ